MELTPERALVLGGTIAAISAVVASLVTGGLAYLAMWHQTKHDRTLRRLEARRMAYARLVAVAFDIVNHLALQPVPGNVKQFSREIQRLMSRCTAAIGEVRILASAEVWEAASSLMDAASEAGSFAFEVLAGAPRLPRAIRPSLLPVINAPGLDQVMAKLAEANNQFVAIAQIELGTKKK